jgi:trans-aconitate methyltransferase
MFPSISNFLLAILPYSIHSFCIHPTICTNHHSMNFALSLGEKTTFTASSVITLIDDFCQLLETSMEENTFESFLIKGPSSKTAKKEELRGCISRVQGRLVTTSTKKKRPSYLQVTFKYHSATDIVKNWDTNPGNQLKEFLTSLINIDDSIIANEPSYYSEWGIQKHPIGTRLGLQSSILTTTTQTLDFNFKTLLFREYPSSPSKNRMSWIPNGHDRIKPHTLKSTPLFWKEIGLDKMTSKQRQCQKFVEVVAQLLASQNSSAVETVDMGCGRGYLTFSLHQYLLDNYNHVRTRGIDVRPKLVEEMNVIAKRLNMTGLSFETGTIQSFEPIPMASSSLSILSETSQIRLWIALHACDTATDDALWSGIQSQAQIIVVAPCCHKQLRPQINDAASSLHHPYYDILRHGIYRERISETVTDSIRAILLEIAQYQVKVFEFIGGEHTSKNVMITAVKRETLRSERELDDLRQRLQNLAQTNGIREQALASWLDESLGTNQPLSYKRMPPL